MNEDLYSIEQNPAIQANRPFLPKMIAISLVLHVICTLVLMGGKAGRQGVPSINYIDLTMSEQGIPVKQQPETVAPLPKPAESAELPSYEETVPQPEAEKLREELQNAVNSAADHPDAIQKVSFGLGMVNGHFGTIADGRTLRDDMREYYLSLLSVINENWWLDKNRLDVSSSAILNVIVNRNGEIVDARILQSSGNQSQDRMMMKSLMDAGPVPPLPAHYESSVFAAPIRFNAPLTLFGSRS